MSKVRWGLLGCCLLLLTVGPGAATSSTTTRFAVIGDFGLAGPDAAAVAALVISWAPDFIVTTGDNNYYDGAAATIDANVGQYYHTFIHPYRGAHGAGAAVNRFFPALGNHDWETADARPYRDYFTLPGNERYYDVVWGPVHLFVVDSNFEEPDGVDDESVQAAWLQQRLAASAAAWKVVVMHHPPYASGPHGSSAWMQWPFAAWGADAVVAGHDHVYERVTVDDFPYFVNGLGGAARYVFRSPIAGSQARYAVDHGAMLVDADATRLAFRFVARTGAVIDTYTLHADPSAVTPDAPGSLAATPVSGAEIDLQWADNASNETGFVIEASAGAPAFTPIATVGRNVTTYPVAGLAPGSTYQFRIRARNEAGESPPSPVAGATTGAAGPPAAPGGLTAVGASPTAIALAWVDAAGNERGYVIEQATDGAAFTAVASLPRDVRAYLAGGLAFQHTYAFRVRAYNAYGFSPFSGTVLARTAAADLVPRSLTGVPAAAAPGEKLRLTARTANQGTIAARSTIARFHLLDGAPSPILLVGKASVTSLAAGAEVNTTASVTVPRSTPVGTFRVRVCVDDGRVVAEGDESNNCLLAAAGLTVGRPDLAVVSLDTPPARVRRGQSFTARDEVENLGVAVATSSTVRYYLGPPSGPETRGPRLAGTHSVPSLLPGARLLKSTSVKVPIDTALGTYRLLACADDRLAVIESDETNNCRVSGATVRVEP